MSCESDFERTWNIFQFVQVQRSPLTMAQQLQQNLSTTTTTLMTHDKDRVSFFFFYLSLYISNLSFYLLLGILIERTTGTVRWRLLVWSWMIGRDEEGDYSEVCISFFIKKLTNNYLDVDQFPPPLFASSFQHNEWTGPWNLIYILHHCQCYLPPPYFWHNEQMGPNNVSIVGPQVTFFWNVFVQNWFFFIIDLDLSTMLPLSIFPA